MLLVSWTPRVSLEFTGTIVYRMGCRTDGQVRHEGLVLCIISGVAVSGIAFGLLLSEGMVNAANGEMWMDEVYR